MVPPLATATVPERYAVVSTESEPAVDFSKPVPEAEKLESVSIFWEVLTVNEVPLYESPVPAVVVAPE